MNHPRRLRRPSREQGLSLIVVLIALVILSFAAIALLRSSDTGTLVAGNVAFQRAALASGDAGTEAAITWLTDNAAGATLDTDDPDNGYYASTVDACDLTGSRTPANATDNVNWTDGAAAANCNMVGLAVTPPGVADGFTVHYVINRVCNQEGNPNDLTGAGGTPMACSRIGAGASEGSTRGGASYGNTPLTGEAQTYYRITTRIDGPRNTVRYVQALVVL